MSAHTEVLMVIPSLPVGGTDGRENTTFGSELEMSNE